MAAADYRLCDVCDGKVFYDSNLNYEQGPSDWCHTEPYRNVGEAQYADPEMVVKYGMRLDYLGDWAVICEDCAKTHKCVIVPIEAPNAGHEGRQKA